MEVNDGRWVQKYPSRYNHLKLYAQRIQPKPKTLRNKLNSKFPKSHCDRTSTPVTPSRIGIRIRQWRFLQ